jgi:predicted phosphodiesterase
MIMKKDNSWSRRFDSKQEFKVPLNIDKNWVSFGLLSDTHYGSLYCNETAIQNYYRDLKRSGIMHAFHSGDIWDGFTGKTQIYQGQLHNVNLFGFDDAVDYIAERYPNNGINTWFILGNHDAKVLEMEGTDFGEHLSRLRSDMIYLQPYYSRLILSDSPRLKLDLVHLDQHVPYTVGYAMQKYLRNVPPSKRADIYSFGHTHHHQHVSVEGDDESFLAGGFQDANEYSIRRGMGSEIGGYKIRMRLNEYNSNPIGKMEATWMNYG